jgi:hypothetical protein
MPQKTNEEKRTGGEELRNHPTLPSLPSPVQSQVRKTFYKSENFGEDKENNLIVVCLWWLLIWRKSFLHWLWPFLLSLQHEGEEEDEGVHGVDQQQHEEQKGQRV